MTVKVKPAPAPAGPQERPSLLLPGQWEKLQAQRASSRFLLPVGTSWVERDVLGIADEINARWPNLRVASCSCGHCVIRGHAPHAVLEHCRDGQTRPVMQFVHFTREIIDRLHAMHTSQRPYEQHAAHNEAVRKELKRQAEEQRAEDLAPAVAALESSKTTYRHGGVRYTPGGPERYRKAE